MKTPEEIKSTIANYRQSLRDQFKVKSLSLFGSYSRNEQTPESDVDILVEFTEVIDLFEYIRLENYLSEILECKVDLVMKDALKPLIREDVLKEAIEI